jgi:hypothetical protein
VCQVAAVKYGLSAVKVQHTAYHGIVAVVLSFKAYIAVVAAGIARYVYGMPFVFGMYLPTKLRQLILYTEFIYEVNKAVCLTFVRAHLRYKAGKRISVKIERQVDGE